MPVSKSDWISKYRQTATNFISAINDFEQLRAQYDALNYSGTLTDADFVGSNAGITADELKNAVSCAGTIVTTFKTGQNTVLYGVKI